MGIVNARREARSGRRIGIGNRYSRSQNGGWKWRSAVPGVFQDQAEKLPAALGWMNLLEPRIAPEFEECCVTSGALPSVASKRSRRSESHVGERAAD
jgi:hypothetical protein